MKILFPIGTFYPATVGGPNLSVYWLTRELKKHDIEPIIVTTDYGIKKEHNIEFNKFLDTDYGKVIYVEEKKHQIPVNTIKMLKKISLKERIDIVHLTSIFYPLSFITYILFKNKSKIIWSPRGELLKGAVDRGKKNIKVIYIKVLQNVLSDNVYFHSTSKEESECIKKYFPNRKIFEISNFISLSVKQNNLIKNQVLYLGRLHSKKNIESLIKAIKLSREFFNQNYKLIIAGVGDTDYTNFLKKEIDKLGIKDYVKFIGHVEGEKKDKLIAESKCLVLPSHSENFGMVVVEALAQGTPVIASKYTPWEELEEFNAGYWIEPTPENLSKALKKIIMMKEEDYKKMRENAFSLAKKYNIKENIHKWINIYEKILTEA